MALPQALWNEVTALTQRYLIPKMQDNIFDSNMLFRRMMKNAKKMDGYREIQAPLMYGTARGGEYSYYDQLGQTNYDDFTVAIFQWAQYFEPITISGREQLINSGKAALLDLVRQKIEFAELGIRDIMGTHLFGSSASYPKRIDGLQDVCSTTANTYGGISRATQTWWANQYSDCIGTDDQIQDDDLVTMLSLCTIDEDGPDMMVTTKGVSNRIELELLLNSERYVNQKEADRGFERIRYHGVPVLTDSHCPTGKLHFLNSKYLKFYVHKKRFFSFDGLKQKESQDAVGGYIFWMGNLCCNNSRMQGLVDGIAEAATV